MKTIAQQLNVKHFPFIINDKNGNEIYKEYSNGYWFSREYDSDGGILYMETSEDGVVIDNRPKSCDDKVVEIDGKKYKLTEVK